MTLLRSFLHHCVAHPLLFAADVATRAGLPAVAEVLGLAHDLAPLEDAPGSHAKGPSASDEDETEGLPVPPQAPLTEAARALMAQPPPPPSAPPPPPAPLVGSVADRVRRARAAG